jgi:hypothetical protein
MIFRHLGTATRRLICSWSRNASIFAYSLKALYPEWHPLTVVSLNGKAERANGTSGGWSFAKGICFSARSNTWVTSSRLPNSFTHHSQAKEETFLCSLASFDAYIVASRHRTPKPFKFAVKSTDKQALFENQEDYLHIFSCDIKSGHAWMEKVLLARVCFSRPLRCNQLTEAQSFALAKAMKDHSGSATNGARNRKPAGPLLSIGGNANTAPVQSRQISKQTSPFEPGSLLGRTQ